MFSYLLGPAFSYWRLPPFAAGSATDRALTTRRDCIDWLPQPRSPDPSEPPPAGQSRAQGICEVLSTNDLYHILGVSRSPVIDRLTLRRAYLSRSKACHPDKCPGNPDATHAFQRVSIAYGVLSQPSLKRMYDASPNGDQPDILRSPPCGYADETLKGVLLSIVSDFLDGNLEMIRTLLQAISDLNPSLKLGDDGINSVLSVLENIRGRVLTCRACILALHSELVRVLEIQYAFRQLPYLDITSRSRLTIQLTAITLSLPVTLEKAIQDAQEDVAGVGGQTRTTDGRNREGDKAALLPKHVVLLIRGIDMVLDKMERVLG
ncbi:hypothetical protein JVT61DRAFT_4318 [Boletus reticuloceps]|uniref:J domain-containing protein n=1 Tax=Boletus reticuloceps TaxID=495285 RepID=A0A8I3A782_9AGAM|nr:hypothetical protein JVT61DRAFT_4318 [Boletus reticuloceps]